VCLYFKEAIKDRALNLAALTFGFGVAQMYLLAETGDRANHGNFWWGAQITLFVLFIVSTTFLLQRASERRDWRVWLCSVVFALHLMSGLVYYFICAFAPDSSLWM
jgi:hypothetical protein